ncbi:MAG: hypothetical protein JXB49_02895 [Bacteroidales bacterium]|nr:hypothetical protein [Bacteroidales bacterium]
MRQIFIVVLAIIWGSHWSFSQDHEPVNFNITPPSPNALSNIKFGDIPVSTYTGIPRIEIPLYEFKGKYIDLPVVMRYHAGGVRVEEIASNVGLGWALSAGGSVSRTVRGLPDDMATSGYLYCGPIEAYPSIEYPPESATSKRYRYFTGREDAEQDIYHVNCGNLSFNFTISKEGIIQKDPQSKIKVEKITGSLISESYGNIAEWRITDENGIKYYFNIKEYSKSTTNNSFFQPISPAFVVTSWYLQKIEAPFGFETIEFEYEPYDYTYLQPLSETYSKGTFSYITSELFLKAQRLKKITTSESNIYLTYDNNGFRCDLNGDRVLNTISIKNCFESEVKTFTLTYQYLTNSGFVNYTPCASGTNQLDKRLILSQIKESGKNPFKFTYKDGLPPRDSKSQDHWGFYNGQQNSSLLPKTYFNNPCYSSEAYHIVGSANRRPDPELVKCGTLTRIEYPTGGSTIFEYEINESTNALLECTYENMTYSLDGLAISNSQITINKIHLPYTNMVFELLNLPAEINDPSCGIRAIIKQNNTELYSIIFTRSEYNNGIRNKSIPVNLANGIYELSFEYLRTDLCPNCSTNPFLLNLKYTNESDDNTKRAGGIRILRITEKPDPVNSTNDIIKWYEYNYPNGKSSGYILHHPVYLTLFKDDQFGQNGLACYFGSLTSSSRAVLGNTQGSPVGYSRVVEHFGENNDNGYIEYFYTSPRNYPDFYGNKTASEFPFAPATSFENCRGLLVKKLTWSNNNELKEKVSNTYVFNYKWDDETISNLKVGSDESWLGDGNIFINQQYVNYQIKSSLVSTRTVIFPAANDSTVTVTDYSYSPDFYQLTQKATSLLSDNKLIVDKYYYPQDFSRGSISAIDKFFNANVFNETIIQETWKGSNISNLSMVASTVNTYKDSLNGKVFLNEVYSLKNNKPLLKSEILEFNPSVLLRKPEYYHRELKIFKYDDKNNILDYSKNNNIRTAILWGCNRTLPIVKILGIAWDSIPSAIRANVASKTFSTGLNINTVKSEVDYLKGQLSSLISNPAYMVTFNTQCPLVGVTSQTDVNNKTTYYLYDAYGNLIKVLDQDLSTIQEYKYHYKE